MCLEIEAKIAVDSLKEVEERLVELDAEFLGEQIQKDNYFDTADGALRKADKGLRIRVQRQNSEEKIILTCKSARQKSEFKKRRQIEFEVADSTSAEKMLLELGYEKVLVFEKKRRIWKLDECEVVLDKLPLLGSFVEIEGPGEKKINRVRSSLSLADLPHVEKSYSHLMDEKLRALGSEEREVFL